MTTALAIPQPMMDALTADQLVRQAALIQEVKEKVLKENEHYGCIPGCGPKPTLLKAGAEKLLMTFRLAAELDVRQTNLAGEHREYLVVATIRAPSGALVAQGVGICSSMEKKYRYRGGGARKCPECGKEAIIKGKADYGGGWLCFAKKGGCGAKWPDGAAAIEGQEVGAPTENPDLADTYNTILKMAKKRALVDGAITATGASDFFAQDLEELQKEVAAEEHRQEKQEAARPTGAAPAAAQSKPATADRQAQQAMTGAGAQFDKTQCEAVFYDLCGAKSLLGERSLPIMTAVWKAAANWDQRGALLTKLLDDVRTIFQVLGDDRGGELADHHVVTYIEQLPKLDKGAKPTPQQIDRAKGVALAFCAEIAAAANGDVTPQPAAAGADQPPF